MQESKMRFITIGYGVQGRKRAAVAGDSSVGIVDPYSKEANYKDIKEVPLNTFDGAFVCTPDSEKKEILKYLLEKGKHVLVEKPLFLESKEELLFLKNLAKKNGATCCTAYNHRFEPHFIKMREVLQSGLLGKVYKIRLFYGNGTARLVKESLWRDKGYGVLPDLGSHLLDTFLFWFSDEKVQDFKVLRSSSFENKAPDFFSFSNNPKKNSDMYVQFDMTLLSWRNHFTADIFAEKGSAHISSLCKWGPSTFTVRHRKFPSGRPTEESHTLVQPDPTWEIEYKMFLDKCEKNYTNIDNDIWIQEKLNSLYNQCA